MTASWRHRLHAQGGDPGELKYAGAPGVGLGPSGAHTHSVLSLPCK